MIPYNKIINAYGAGIALGGKKGSKFGDPVCYTWDEEVQFQYQTYKEDFYTGMTVEYSIDGENWTTISTNVWTPVLTSKKFYLRRNSDSLPYGYNYCKLCFKAPDESLITNPCIVSGDVSTLLRKSGTTNYATERGNAALNAIFVGRYQNKYALNIVDASDLLIPFESYGQSITTGWFAKSYTTQHMPLEYGPKFDTDKGNVSNMYSYCGTADNPLRIKESIGVVHNTDNLYGLINYCTHNNFIDFELTSKGSDITAGNPAPYHEDNVNVPSDTIKDYDPSFRFFFMDDEVYEQKFNYYFKYIETKVDITVNWYKWPTYITKDSQTFRQTDNYGRGETGNIFRCPAGFDIPDQDNIFPPKYWTVIRY